MVARPLRVGIDVTPLLPQPTGVDRYMTELVAAFGRLAADADFTLFANRDDRDQFGGLSPRFNVSFVGSRNRVARLAIQQTCLPGICAARGIDVLHSPSFLMPWFRGHTRHVLTVHDMTFFTLPQVHTRLRRSDTFTRMVLASIRRASSIVVPSATVRDELLARVPATDAGRVRVTPYGVSTRFGTDGALDASRLAALPWLPRAPFVLSVGTLEPRKNLPVLIEAFRRLVRAGLDLHLVLVGGAGQARAAIEAAISSAGLSSRVHLPGFMSDETLAALYRSARVFAFPSLAEGFGFPPLEAMASGLPVVASTGSALAENLRGAAVLVPPDDPGKVADAIHAMVSDEAARDRAIAAGLERASRFTWDETARLTLDCYRAAALAASQRLTIPAISTD
jgi:glycosyltransferase involved in cell wall biosynthesis